jgi:hypothetical protein
MSDFAASPEAGDEDTGPVTIYDIQSAEDSKVRLRALPRLTRQALRLAWAAGPRDFMISTDDDALGRGWTNGWDCPRNGVSGLTR